MDLIEKAKCAPPPVPITFEISKTIKKNQLPAYDAFGPFPDETLLANVDRMLFFLGARNVQKFFNLPTPSMDEGSNSSDGSITISKKSCPSEHERMRSCTTFVKESCCPISDRRTVSVTKNACCAKCRASAERVTTSVTRPHQRNVSCACCTPHSSKQSSKLSSKLSSKQSSKDTTSRVTIGGHSVCGQGDASIGLPGKAALALKRSFSLCSLACRKIREKLGFQSTKASTPKWIWTRMQSHADGYEIYEVFKNSNVCTHPTQLDASGSNPQVIFVVLPNGVIIPFESLSCHK